MKNYFIVVEGVDGAGKSAISLAVAMRLGAIHLESPIGGFKDIRKHVDEELCDKGRFLFYLASNFALSNAIRKHKKTESNPIVCARYFYSTIIGYASRNNINIDHLQEKIPVSMDDLDRPDLTIFLHVDKENQKKRIESRSPTLNSSLDYKSLNDEIYQVRLFDNYSTICKNEGWVRIDTSTMNEETVVEACIEEINRFHLRTTRAEVFL